MCTLFVISKMQYVFTRLAKKTRKSTKTGFTDVFNTIAWMSATSAIGWADNAISNAISKQTLNMVTIYFFTFLFFYDVTIKFTIDLWGVKCQYFIILSYFCHKFGVNSWFQGKKKWVCEGTVTLTFDHRQSAFK